jgi:hypothetical protein
MRTSGGDPVSAVRMFNVSLLLYGKGGVRWSSGMETSAGFAWITGGMVIKPKIVMQDIKMRILLL